VKQAVSKASTSFSSDLNDFARLDWPVPGKGWDEGGPDHPFLCVRIQIPLRPCLAVVLPPQPWARWVFVWLQYIVRKVML
jgi:hypothetical protein